MAGQGQILWRLVGICSLLLLVVSPWLYASASWSVQWWLFVLGLVLGLLLLGNVVGSSVGLAGNLEGGRVVRWRPPAVAWVFLVLGCFAQVQSLRWWDADLPAHWPFSSISLQQWALGFPAGGKHDSRWEEAEERVLGGEEARLAISVEPMTTRGASSISQTPNSRRWGPARGCCSLGTPTTLRSFVRLSVILATPTSCTASRQLQRLRSVQSSHGSGCGEGRPSRFQRLHVSRNSSRGAKRRYSISRIRWRTLLLRVLTRTGWWRLIACVHMNASTTGPSAATVRAWSSRPGSRFQLSTR